MLMFNPILLRLADPYEPGVVTLALHVHCARHREGERCRDGPSLEASPR